MPIPKNLNDAHLSFDCPGCKHPIIRKGSWFKVISTFRCSACHKTLRLGYPEKLRIFERHKHLAATSGRECNG
ncbi:hypothetical protein DPM33_01095 [Mesorhizobium hawassense]|uniref:Uncharacterized protein n=1 Tax=Mesorhizobium hawassense TaxID=1209954 RepID=A0A330HYA3_9HYPH|nr:hypothetical protein DPM33_01095 [Mesorhizobium hawassense]